MCVCVCFRLLRLFYNAFSDEARPTLWPVFSLLTRDLARVHMCVKWMFVSVCRRGAGLLCVCRWPVQRSWAGYSPPLSVQPLSLPFSWEACRGSGWTVPLFRKLRPREWIHPTNCPLDVQRSYLQQRLINKLYVLAGGRYSNAEFTLKDCCCNFSFFEITHKTSDQRRTCTSSCEWQPLRVTG